MTHDPRILLVELGDSHGEVLLTQLSACRDAGYPCELVANAALVPRLHSSLRDGLPVHPVRCDGPLRRVRAAWAVRRRIEDGGFTHVVINTASGNAIQLLSRVLPSGVRVVGILHDVKRLASSSRQRVISRRVRDYLVLADHLIPKAGAFPGLRFGAFYPIEYPQASDAPASSSEDVLHLVVPGGVSLRRRDYLRLVDLLKATPESVRSRLRVELLGAIDRGDGRQVRAALDEAGFAANVVVHEGFVPEDDFYRIASSCDAILPLLPLSAEGVEAYGSLRISGSFNLAYAYRKPLIVHPDYRGHPDLDRVGIFHDPDGGLPDPGAFAAEGERVSAAYAEVDRFDPNLQKRRWLDFVLER